MKCAICFFCSLSDLHTGMPISTFKLVEHFSYKKDYDVHVVHPSEGEFARKVRQLNARCTIIPFVRLRSPAHPAAFAAAFFSAIPAWFRLLRYLRRNRIALIHFSDIIDLLYYPVARLAGCRSVVHLRMCITNTALRMLFGVMTRYCADRIICISDAVRRHFDWGNPRAVTIYNTGPAPNLFNPSRTFMRPREMDIASAAVLAIGPFVKAKGHEYFVRMAARVSAAAEQRTQFYILGGKVAHHARYWKRVMDEIRNLGLENRLTIFTPVGHEQVPAILSSVEVFVHLPHCHEGLGGVILEAMAMAKPVVAFDSGGIRECFTNGVSGFLVPHLDVEAAAEKVMLLLRDEELRARMGAAARKEVLEKFSYEKHFSAVEAVYRECLALDR